jgi:ABC-type transport system substrate-binding protein
VRMLWNRSEKVRSVALAAALVLLATAGCRSGPVAAVPDKPPRDGGTLRMALDADPVSITPLGGRDAAGLLVERNVFAGLVDVAPDTLRPVPSIAQRWKVSDDRRRVTFTLRDDVEFQRGGGPVTADTFVRDWALLCSPDVGSPGATVLRPVEGFAECAAGSGFLSGVRAIDPRTLEVRLTAPYRNFVMSLSDPATWAFPPERNDTAAERAEFELDPLGAGPFQVNTLTRTLRPPGKAVTPGLVVLARNPGYFGPRPRLRRVELPVLSAAEHPARAFKLYRTGSLDVLGVPPALVDIVRADPGLRAQLIGYPRLELTYLRAGVRVSRAERRGVANALNPRRVVSLALGKFGQAADGIVPLGTPGYVPEAGPVRVQRAGTFGAIAVARPSDPLLEPIADAVVQVLTQNGLDAQLADGGQWRVETRTLRYPAPEAAIAPFAGVTPQARRLYARLLATGDEEVQVDLQRAILEESAIVPIAFGQAELLVTSRAGGVHFDGLGTLHFAKAWIGP